MITLNDFIAIANGSHNVGQITVSGTGENQHLTKVNNHVWFTGKNNVQLTAAQNRATREALLQAITNSGRQNVGLYRDILLGEGRASQSLSRDFVKTLLATTLVTNARDRLGEIMATTSDMVGREKRLAERKITVPGQFTPGVTSTKDAAYVHNVSERMDAGFRMATTALVRLSRIGGNYLAVADNFPDVFKGLRDAAHEDTRLSATQRQAFTALCRADSITAILQEIYQNAKNSGLLDIGPLVVQQLTEHLAQKLDNILGVDGAAIKEEYLARLSID